MKIITLHLTIIFLWIVGCNEQDPLPSPLENTGEVYVLNEGNFSSGNGTIDAFNIATGETQNSIYNASATIQTARSYNSNIYLIANAPDRIDVLTSDLSLVRRIGEGLDNPIDFTAVGNRGFVTNWGNINTAFSENPDSFVAVIDLTTYEVIDSVLLSARPQGIIAVNDRLFIANEGSNTITVIETQNLTTQDIEIAAGPSNLIANDQGKVWALCTSGTLVEINAGDLSIVSELSGLITNGFNEKMVYDQVTNRLYFLGGTNDSFTGLTTVYKVDLNTQAVEPIIENGFAFYGIGVSSETGEIYVGDSNAFQSTGTAFRYDDQGILIDQFATGIGPNGFLIQ